MDMVFDITPKNAIHTLLELSNNYSYITINIDDFVTILYAGKAEGYEQFMPTVDREILVAGQYGTINNMTIMVKKHIKPGYMQVEKENDGK